VLTALLWFGSLFAQTYFYTAPADGIYWKAPAAAGILTAFYFVWSMLNVWGGTAKTAGPTEIPFGVVWEFSPRVDVIAEPVPQFWSKRRSSEKALYVLDRSSPPAIKYQKQDSDEYWSPGGVEYVQFECDGTEYTFKPDKERSHGYMVFVDANSGLEMKEFEIGRVGYMSWGRLMTYLFLNVIHLLLWIVCLWVLLGFQLRHAWGLGFILWIAATVAILPGVFERAAAAVT
jgi:hypothetical protein